MEWLGQKENPAGKGWAAGAGYGAKIITILNAMIGIKSEAAEPEEVWYRVRKTWADFDTQKGAFTIVEEAEGKGASLWGLLKSYQKNRDGWISMDYAEKV